jgi:hypothetical protein
MQLEFWHPAISMLLYRTSRKRDSHNLSAWREFRLFATTVIAVKPATSSFCGEDLWAAFTEFQALSLWNTLEVRKSG